MSIFRTIALFIYLFGYMIVHYGALRRGERALAAGDTQLVEELVNKNIPRWSRGILKVTGVSLVVEGLENIPKDTACVFVGNHRSYYDIPLLLASLDKPHGVLAKEELEKIPLLNRWMKLLGCVFVQRDDLRASVRALNDATAIVESGKSFVIFPEGTRYKGEEGGAGEFKAGAFRIAVKTGAPVVPVAITGARALFENNGNLCHPGSVHIKVLPPIRTGSSSFWASTAPKTPIWRTQSCWRTSTSWAVVPRHCCRTMCTSSMSASIWFTPPIRRTTSSPPASTPTCSPASPSWRSICVWPTPSSPM